MHNHAPPDSELPRGNGEHLLIVDDEPALVSMGKRRLEILGYQVTGYTSPFAALDHLRASPLEFDLLITDFTMPGMNGLELTAAAGDVRADLPVVILTGNRAWLPPDVSACANLKLVLEKPVTMRDLGLALDGVFGRVP